MLPPVLEIYVLWHPGDEAGEGVAEQLIGHFHGNAFSGLIGGAVEVFVRSEGWEEHGAAPRPLPVVAPLPHDLREPALTVIVPVVGLELGAAVEPGTGPWHDYIAAAVDARNARPDVVAIVPVRVAGAPDGGTLIDLVAGIQAIRAEHEDLCRDLSQAVAQFLIDDDAGSQGLHQPHQARRRPRRARRPARRRPARDRGEPPARVLRRLRSAGRTRLGARARGPGGDQRAAGRAH